LKTGRELGSVCGVSPTMEDVMEESLMVPGRDLEEAFFRKNDQELIERMRAEKSAEARRKALAEVSGIKDRAVLDQLVAHDIRPETLTALTLVPVIEVAWADGEVQPEERHAVLKAAEQNGVARGSAAYELIGHWLAQKPDPKLLATWNLYVRSLCAVLPESTRQKLKGDLLGHAETVARAAGGILGLGRVSADEKVALARLESAFH
jgi:hypothetical protein